MNNKEELFSEEQMDFLCEMMNIGAGNAATAFTQMLQCEVDVKIPRVHMLAASEAPSILDDPSLPVVCVRMSMVGDVAGSLFFMVPDEQKTNLIHLVEQASGLRIADRGINRIRNETSEIRNGLDFSALTEMGNILAGVYLTAIHDFCRLNIYHSVPTIARDMIQSFIAEPLAASSHQVQTALLVENEFIVEKNRIRTFLLMIPTVLSVKVLVNSIEQARLGYGEG